MKLTRITNRWIDKIHLNVRVINIRLSWKRFKLVVKFSNVRSHINADFSVIFCWKIKNLI